MTWHKQAGVTLMELVVTLALLGTCLGHAWWLYTSNAVPQCSLRQLHSQSHLTLHLVGCRPEDA